MSGTAVPLLIAHRGASRDAPENSLAAFDLAWQQGADGIEADFHLTRDGRVVCIHDVSTGRTAGIDLIVATATLDELRHLDIGARKGSRWQGERIVALEEILSRLPAGKLFFIELKCGQEIIEPLVRLLDGSGVPPEQLRILTFDPGLIGLISKHLPMMRTCLNVDYRWNLYGRSWSPTRTEVRAALERLGAAGLSSRAHRIIDAQFISELRQQGMEIHVWTVDSPRAARHFRNLGVDSILTNRPGWLRQKMLES